MRSSGLILASLFCLGVAGTYGHADTCQPEQASRKIAWIENGMESARHKTRLWANLWGATWAAASVAEISLALLADSPDTQKDRWVNSTGPILGLVPTLIVRPRVLADDPPDAGEGPCARLNLLEAKLDRDTDDDERHSSWLAYTTGIALNAIRATILGPGFGHWSAAGFTLATGIPFSVIMTYSYPRAAAQLRERYRAGDDTPAPRKTSLLERTGASVFSVPSGAGAVLSISI